MTIIIIRDVYGLHLRKSKWKVKVENPGFTAEVILQIHSLDGIEAILTKILVFPNMISAHIIISKTLKNLCIILPLGRLHENRNT